MNNHIGSKPNLNDPWDYAVCCIEMAMQMSLYNSPLRGACSSENKAYLSELEIGQIKKLSGAEYVAKMTQVNQLYSLFLSRTYADGEETINELDFTGDEYSAIAESTKGSMVLTGPGSFDIGDDESEVEAELEDDELDLFDTDADSDNEDYSDDE